MLLLYDGVEQLKRPRPLIKPLSLRGGIFVKSVPTTFATMLKYGMWFPA